MAGKKPSGSAAEAPLRQREPEYERSYEPGYELREGADYELEAEVSQFFRDRSPPL